MLKIQVCCKSNDRNCSPIYSPAFIPPILILSGAGFLRCAQHIYQRGGIQLDHSSASPISISIGPALTKSADSRRRRRTFSENPAEINISFGSTTAGIFGPIPSVSLEASGNLPETITCEIFSASVRSRLLSDPALIKFCHPCRRLMTSAPSDVILHNIRRLICTSGTYASGGSGSKFPTKGLTAWEFTSRTTNSDPHQAK
ncbi:hypothetical protein B0H17DRAFT_120106 [Mycena rosella]|uniref:Uncharacterized protein n=1 Tax=Mycena rosella TaxID=1033263 RepID=A0AAD7DYP5_MYCRO|nr:hypothetical protein B0H17DRAFT_120106 [Mycena rosella]